LELHREARERLAVNLSIDRVLVERFANDGIGFEEMDAVKAAELSEPKRRQIAQVAKAALGRENENFEVVLVEVRAGGDFYGPP